MISAVVSRSSTVGPLALPSQMYLNGGDNLDELAYHPVGRGEGGITPS